MICCNIPLRRASDLWMKLLPSVKVGVLALAGSFLFGGCVYRERVAYRHRPGRVVIMETVGTEVVVKEAPPAPIVEAVTIAPASDYVWVGGAWVWRGGWVWDRGHWDRPPRVGLAWVPHRYVYRGGAHVFVRGGWR